MPERAHISRLVPPGTGFFAFLTFPFASNMICNTMHFKVMHWIAPSEKGSAHAALEKHLWDAADQFRANSGLKSQEYSAPVLGLIFLRFAEVRFAAQRAKL
jgi:hypothetical protein